MERKAFTIVESLVVVAVMALLMAILMPGLSKARQLAFRLRCGTNLAGIGKAALAYANDYEDQFPISGLTTSIWGAPIRDWKAPDRPSAFAATTRPGFSGPRNPRCQPRPMPSLATTTSCFYLLVKYGGLPPESFLCKGDSGVTEFRLSDDDANGMRLVDLWDFGNEPMEHCSYSYHMPFGAYRLTAMNSPGMAVAADRNPWQDSSFAGRKVNTDFDLFDPDGDREAIKHGNATVHREQGQNVLFLDGHLTFEKRAFCAINDDNIYTWSDGTTDARRGDLPILGASGAMRRTDSFLVTDGQGVRLDERSVIKE